MAPTVSKQDQALHTWNAAKQTRTSIVKALDELQKSKQDAIETALDNVEDKLAQFRLNCMASFFTWAEIGRQDKDVLEALWQTQMKINQVYRGVIAKLKDSAKANVTRNKAERKYQHYMKIAQDFYKAFIQRLASRFIVPEIQEVCSSFRLKILPESNRLDVPNIKEYLFKSCYDSLLHLGDLSRYRYQISHRGIESGVTYYSLAHRFAPNNGAAHHQLGVLFHEQGRHLEITYHFFRAIVCEHPHQNARKNLDVEFKRALKGDFLNRKGNNTTPQDVLRLWFIRLHAHFHEGKDFTEYNELENEVVHRLGRSWKSQDMSKDLFYILLVNFAAYYFAATSVDDEGIVTKPQYHLFALRLIVRTTLSLSDAVHNEIVNLADERRRLSPDGTQPTQEVFPEPVARLLPLFRLTCGWLVYHTHDIVKYGARLQPYMTDMYRMFTKAQTSFYNAFSRTDIDVSDIATYLLDEDQEAVGFLPLENKDVYYGLRFQYGKDGERKPRPIKDTQRGPLDENWWRVTDILNCGMFLALDPNIPIQLSDVNGISELVYEETQDLTVRPSPNAEKTGPFDEMLDMIRRTSRAPHGDKSGDKLAVPQTPAAAESPLPTPAALPLEPLPPVKADGKKLAAAPGDDAPSNPCVPLLPNTEASLETSHTAQATPKPISAPSAAVEETSEILEDSMVNMVDNLVDGSTADTQSKSSQNTSAYGVGNTTADLLSKLSTPNKAIPSLPWNYFVDTGSGSFGAVGTRSPQTQYANSASVNQQIYGGSAAFNGFSSKKYSQSSPGWTDTQVKVGPQWAGQNSDTDSPSCLTASKLTVGNNIWMPNMPTHAKPQAQLEEPRQQPSQPAAEPSSTTNPAPGPNVSVVPLTSLERGTAGPPNAQSDNDYKMLYQRLAGMAGEASHKPGVTGRAFTAGAPAAGYSFQQGSSRGQSQKQQQRTGVSPASIYHHASPREQTRQISTGMTPNPSYEAPMLVAATRQFSPGGGTIPAKSASNLWPQYGKNSFTVSSPTDAVHGTSTAPTRTAVSSTPTASTALNPTGSFAASGFPSSSGSIWGSTPTNGGGNFASANGAMPAFSGAAASGQMRASVTSPQRAGTASQFLSEARNAGTLAYANIPPRQPNMLQGWTTGNRHSQQHHYSASTGTAGNQQLNPQSFQHHHYSTSGGGSGTMSGTQGPWHTSGK